jgi:hypothetical protein
MVCSAPTLLAGDTEPTRPRMQMTASDLYPWGSGNVRERPERRFDKRGHWQGCVPFRGPSSC